MDEILGISGNEATVVTVGYARVSTHGQKDDLSRQIEFLRSTYPDAEIVSEVGSGLNFRRRKFLAILERVLSGDLKRLVIAYPDRLVRFGFELVEWICDRQKCELVVLNDRKLSPHNELVQDMLSIIHCFSSRLDGLRKYEKLLKEGVQKVPTEQVPETQTQRCQEDTGLSL